MQPGNTTLFRHEQMAAFSLHNFLTTSGSEEIQIF